MNVKYIYIVYQLISIYNKIKFFTTCKIRCHYSTLIRRPATKSLPSDRFSKGIVQFKQNALLISRENVNVLIKQVAELVAIKFGFTIVNRP